MQTTAILWTGDILTSRGEHKGDFGWCETSDEAIDDVRDELSWMTPSELRRVISAYVREFSCVMENGQIVSAVSTSTPAIQVEKEGD